MKKIIIFNIFVLFSASVFGQNETFSDHPQKKEKKIGYYHAVDLGTGFGASKNHNSYCKPQPWTVFVNETHGIQFNPHLMLGLNIGFMYISPAACNSYCHDLAFNYGLSFRYTILKNKWSPFLLLTMGNGFEIFVPEENTSWRMKAQFIQGVNTSLYAGCRYEFGCHKEVSGALGFETLIFGPALRIGVRF